MSKASKIVRTQNKGMVTIPVEYRQRLGIDENTFLQAKMVKNGVLFVKIEYQSVKDKKNSGQKPVTIYPDNQIKQWILRDKIDAKTALKLQKILNS